MTFAANGLMKIAQGAPSADTGKMTGIWHYTTPDPKATVEADGYFDGQGPDKGDIIILSLNLDGTPVFMIKGVNGSADDVALVDIIID